MIKWKLTEEERFKVQKFRVQILNAAYEDDFYQIINGLLNATQRFKEF